MDTVNQVQDKIENWHKVLNHFESLPSKAFRRNVAVYELVSYVNHIVACYVCGNYHPIDLFIERAREYIEKNPVKDRDYYNKVESYFKDMELFLSNKASVTKL